jgi:hypothetical protein
LVRSELLFAGCALELRLGGYDSVAADGERAQKWMALLNAHFMSLPASILNHDIVVNDAYWRCRRRSHWFLRSIGRAIGYA